MSTKKEIVAIAIAVCESVRAAGPEGIPEGPVYAQLMGMIDIHGWHAIMANLTNSGLVEVRGHVMRWVGPRSFFLDTSSLTCQQDEPTPTETKPDQHSRLASDRD
jgi:hypothetical protein